MSDDIAELNDSIKTLDKDVAQATEQRKQEHAEYQETAQLTKAAIELMGRAKNRLQKFYNPALYVAPPTTAAPPYFFQAAKEVRGRLRLRHVHGVAPDAA